MRALVAAACCVLVSPGVSAAAWQTDLVPADRLRGAVLTLDYERPWGGLEVDRGGVRGGLPLPLGLWIGGTVAALRAPTVEETGLGGWVLVQRLALLSIERSETVVSGLDPVPRLDAKLVLRLASGPASFGWSARGEGIRSGEARVWRHWWVALAVDGGDLVLGRRSTPWTPEPSWTAAIRLALGDRLDSTLGWQGGEATLALTLVTGFASLTSATGWTGPRSGGFGFRLEAGRR